jgi:DNA-binding transcriptional ArsR family regulator
VTAAVAATLGALADDTRRSVVELLARRPMSAGAVASELDVSPAALTRHLRVLRQAGLVAVTLDDGDNRRHVYALRPEPLRRLREWADDVTTFWADQLGAFTDHVDARR